MKRMIKAIPFAKKTYGYFQKLEYERRFAGDCYGCFHGVFDTFEQAIQSAPKTKPIGYDNDELAQEYKEMAELGDWERSKRTVASYDYPVLFWLSSIFTVHPVNTIFDFGGNVGIHFYTYRKYINFDKVKWIVCDLPEIAKAGEELAKKRQEKDLLFTTSFTDASHTNILIASGSVQYINNFSKEIEQLPKKPTHILINRLPIHSRKQFVTLQNGGKVFYPQYVFSKKEFIDSFNNTGYELIDIWEDSVDRCVIPFDAENSVSFYHGIYFKLRS